MKKLLLLLSLILPFHSYAARLFVASNSDKIVVPGDSAIITGSHSYSWWMKPSSIPTSGVYQRIYSDGNGVASVGIGLSYEFPAGQAEHMCITTGPSFGNYIAKNFNISLSTGVWYHCAATIDPSLDDTNEVKFYLNGTAQTLTSSDGSWVTNSAFYGTAGIGVLRWTPDIAFFDGVLAQFIWIKGVLTPAEITALARGADFYKIRPPESYGKAYPIDGLSAIESDISPSHAHLTSISGTSKANGPPTVPR